jgi:DNA-binding LytR/AlgR family response regulator
MTMKTIEGLLPANLFLRIHRSYIVSRTCVLKIAPWLVQVNNIELPIGKKYKEAIQRLSIEQQANAKQIGKPFVQP